MGPVIYKRRGAVPPCVSDFLERTQPGTASIKTEMGVLAEKGIREQEFYRLCHQFANGVQYISDKYKVAPKKIVLKDYLEPDDPPKDKKKLLMFDRERDSAALYDADTQTIEISRAWLEDIIVDPFQEFFVDRRDSQYPISRKQFVFLVGFEEANHHKQTVSGSRAQRKGYFTIDTKPEEPDYWDNPRETANRKDQIAVARELGMIPKVRHR
jgi:hypothetical protein